MVIDYGKIIFGGVDSSEYGIYVSGEGTYNAPERAVEFVTVPGRNGAIAMDQGYYENITVTYQAMYIGKDQEDFREKLMEFRNAILSQKGYQRLEDTYHPDEYRMGVYAAGLEVSRVFTKMRGGEFELEFTCKPQRYLTVGDYPIPVDSGDIIENPTLFDAGPLLEIEGYGDISFNGYTVSLADGYIGDVELIPRSVEEYSGSFAKSHLFDTSLVNTGDDITINPAVFTYYMTSSTAMYTGVSYSVDNSSSVSPTVTVPSWSANNRGNSLVTTITFPQIVQDALAESAEDVYKYAKVTITGTKYGGGTDTVVLEALIRFRYGSIRYLMTATPSGTPTVHHLVWNIPAVMVDSTVNLLGHPTYIDCEYGEAYRIVDGEYQSLNAYVALGSDLPKMSPGLNRVTFDNTVTDLKIAPRWWRI